MDYNEARKTLGMISHFFRALRKMEEVLEEAQSAKVAIVDAESQLKAMQSEHDAIASQMADLKPKHAKLKQTYDAKTAEKEAELSEWADKQKVELQEQIADLKIQLATLETEEKTAKAEYEANMKMYAGQEQEAKESVKYWQIKLSEAQAEFEAFKKRLS
jgi:septal ring factor EnvC (AmiA/AmiB activator)